MRENAAVSGSGRTEIRTADQARWQGIMRAAVRPVLARAPWGCTGEQGRSEKIVRAEKRYIIEVSGKGAGILVAADGAYVFHAALPEARSLDQRVFRSLEQAEKSISQQLTRKRKPT